MWKLKRIEGKKSRCGLRGKGKEKSYTAAFPFILFLSFQNLPISPIPFTAITPNNHFLIHQLKTSPNFFTNC